MTKAEAKKLYKTLIDCCPVDYKIPPGTREFELLVNLTKHLPLVYAELPKPTFQVSVVVSNKARYKCLHIWKGQRFIPITATKVFASTKGNANSGSNKRKRVLSALRFAIKPQIDLYKSKVQFPYVCPLSQRLIKSFNSTHVDHHKLPFKHIVENFLQLERRTIESVSLGRDGLLADVQLSASWCSYHEQVADLVLVDKTANLKKGSKLI